MVDKKEKKSNKGRSLAVPFLAAIALSGIGGNIYLNDRADKELIKIAAHEDTPDLECIADNLELFKQESQVIGDDHDVIIIPGFATNDKYMSYLTDAIIDAGYKASGWDAGFNTGDTENKAKLLEAKIIDIYSNNGNKKISLVGYSLGGIYAREVARKHQDKIRNVITLSSPFGMEDQNGNPDHRVKRIYDSYNTNLNKVSNPLKESLLTPSSAIISNSDLIVNWKVAIQKSNDISENIVLDKGHISLPFSEITLNIILERLRQKSDNWQSIKSKNCI